MWYIYIYIYQQNTTQPQKRKKKLPFARIWMYLEGIILRAISQTER